MKKKRRKNSREQRKIRYAVVGLGYIAQAAVLPAFANARENSELTALVSSDPLKLQKLSKKYGVKQTYSYDEFDQCLNEGSIDAVYIALPNSMHHEYTVRAAQAGIHVLCEKPMAVTEEECKAMIRAADQGGAKLMIAYRLHFDEANLKAMESARSGKLGELRIFNSLFCMQVGEGNIRLREEMGGGPLFDIGIYCINAARHLFQAEPMSVSAFNAAGEDARFSSVEEMTGAVLTFPGNRLASFVCSFGASDVSSYQLVGSKGDLQVEMAYEFASPVKYHLTIGGRTRSYLFAKKDQFAPELLHFSRCILNDVPPQPSGREGLADIRVIQALMKSAKDFTAVRLEQFEGIVTPQLDQKLQRPAARKPTLVHAKTPSMGGD
jgi:glucose-fructose oxidoreductase